MLNGSAGKDPSLIQSFCCDTVTSLCNMNENSKGDDEDGDNAPPDMYYMLNGSGGNYDY